MCLNIESVSVNFYTNHNLPIVKGKCLGRPLQERLYTKCNERGDEFHIALVCRDPKLIPLRRKYIYSYYCSHPSMYKFVKFLQSTNDKIVQNLALYIYYGLKIVN